MAAENNVVALTKPEPHMRDATRAFEPNSIAEASTLAKILVASRLLPKSITTPEAAFTIIATGRELGLTAMQSIRSIHVIEGKACLSADLIAALIKKHPECEYFRVVETTAQIATYETKRRGEPEPTRMSFTHEDATRAGVMGKDNWKKFPGAMLRARAITALGRAVYPDALMGVYDPDELVRDDGERPGLAKTAPLRAERVIDLEPDTKTPPSPGVRPTEPGPVDSEDRWALFAQKMIDAVEDASDVETLKTWTSRIKTIPEPFLTPVREAYSARLKVLRQSVAGGAQ